MSTNFLKLPSELRNRIYELCLLHEEPINPWIDYNQRHELTTGLLRANKTIYREASSLLYAQNRFDFTMATPEDVASFLKTIRNNNADCIRHICVDFPSLRNLEPGNVTLEEGSDDILASIQSSCANLRTLTTPLSSTHAMELRLDALDNPKVVTEALTLVNTRFRAISSLQDIVVEVYDDGPSDIEGKWRISDGQSIQQNMSRSGARAGLSATRKMVGIVIMAMMIMMMIMTSITIVIFGEERRIEWSSQMSAKAIL